MSFRKRLTAFFVMIVIVPMLAVAIVLVKLVDDSQSGKSDAQVGQAQRSASGLFRLFEARAAQAGRQIGADPSLANAIRSNNEADIRTALTTLMQRDGATRVLLEQSNGQRIVLGDDTAVAPGRSQLLDERGQAVGRLSVAVVTASQYVADVSDLSGFEAVIDVHNAPLATTLQGAGESKLPLRGTTKVGGTEYTVAGFQAPAFDPRDGRVTIRVLADEAQTRSQVSGSSLLVAAILIGFLVAAFGFALFVSRSLQAQVQRLLDAAQRLGGGDFRVAVPEEGGDEFAALASEFNSMARQLEGRLDELQRERGRLQGAIRRVGESFAKGLDRDALLRIIVQTSVDGVGADGGRATVLSPEDATLRPMAGVGELDAFRHAMHAAESAVIDAQDLAEVETEGVHALAHPLRRQARGVVGVLCVARTRAAFSDAEKELFAYLANQASISIENVDLHEAVQRQAVTDELTGLFNHRRFQEVISVEVERAKRFHQDLGLIMLDVDDFKRVNDTYGHMQGDLVLREVARVLRESSREIDEPARYGGEEMAVALPQTDLEGAVQFAERVRRRISELRVPLLDGTGELGVTASFGAAALPRDADWTKDALVAAADAALYRAKRAGKDRTERADPRDAVVPAFDGGAAGGEPVAPAE